MRREMAAGRLLRGERLPSAKEAASLLDINLHTVLRAYQTLRDEGLIDLRRGRGAVVTAPDPAGGPPHACRGARHGGPTRGSDPRRPDPTHRERVLT